MHTTHDAAPERGTQAWGNQPTADWAPDPEELRQEAEQDAQARCPRCGMLEGGTFCQDSCYGGTDQAQEAADYDANAAYDSVRERYAGESGVRERYAGESGVFDDEREQDMAQRCAMRDGSCNHRSISDCVRHELGL